MKFKVVGTVCFKKEVCMWGAGDMVIRSDSSDLGGKIEMIR